MANRKNIAGALRRKSPMEILNEVVGAAIDRLTICLAAAPFFYLIVNSL